MGQRGIVEIKNASKTLVETLNAALGIAGNIDKACSQMTQVPVPLSELPEEINRRLNEYDLTLKLLSEQSGVAINSVRRAITNPESMRLATLQKVIEPLGLSLCFEKQ